MRAASLNLRGWISDTGSRGQHIDRQLPPVTIDPEGSVYFASLNCVFKLDSNGVVTRIAGNSRGED